MKKIIVSYAGMSQQEHKHAQTIMSELGITWREQIPDSASDSWKFYGCDNIPEKLPSFVSVYEMTEWDYKLSGLSPQQEVK
ncbi:TPA: hypothetical protein ACTYBD_000352 [Enterobacter hormaechei]|uniref:hypothetical protein n=1 Tax=Enterobacter hormaechei TaxID=158836 RepID=UPI001A1A2E9C|nr:hypothetical protein [Enterobacter hormaechei]HAS0757222.1 hypothetical protein [Enterobacter hormaechei subsp. xiangfangensis]EKS6329487.1 hypothetical protein [Enterobacter hormaechei]EKS6508467.1 hypothetical protein [Enterobacter hormaechei]EKT4031110.1 hypothetical protein [Enterobacter hormaechei]EKZ1440477.1 hypothetical protein [Enterobacter hormaechei]